MVPAYDTRPSAHRLSPAELWTLADALDGPGARMFCASPQGGAISTMREP